MNLPLFCQTKQLNSVGWLVDIWDLNKTEKHGTTQYASIVEEPSSAKTGQDQQKKGVFKDIFAQHVGLR